MKSALSKACNLFYLFLQVQQFSNKSTDMSLRVASLEYLGIVAARLRRDAVSSHMDQETINDIVDKARLHYVVYITFW